MERRDDRDADRCSAAARRCRGWRSSWRGARSPAARCSSWCRCRPCCASRPTCACRSAPTSEHVRTIGRNFVPVLLSRGVVQVSAYIDHAARQPACRPARSPACRTRRLLYTLPVKPVRDVGRPRRSCRRCPAIAGADPRGDRSSSADGSTPASGASRSSSCPPLSRFSRWATSSSARCCRPAGSAMRDSVYVWGFWLDRRSDCWRRRSGGCIRRPTTRSAIRGLRCGTRSCASP